ncbi:MAG TPA: Hpt domain-containing protein [Terriglobales bacterium]|jgi:HPt (histidine-containing phosphotransfer) domain-containing protein
MPENENTLASQVFDQLRQAMASDAAAFTELYRDYLADAWRLLGMLREAVQQQQLEELRAKAHHLKGSSMVLGARAVAQCATSLEEMGRQADVQGAVAMLERTHQALQHVQSELADRLGAGVVPADKSAA